MGKRKMSIGRSTKNTDNFRVELKPFQKEAENFLRENDISVFTGAAGTGKDFIQLHRAVQGFLAGEFEEIIFMRTVIEVGTGIGFIPGTEKEKLDPYQQAFLDNLRDMLEPSTFKRISNIVRFEHTGYCRGKTFKRACIIVSEIQNCTLTELMTISSRFAQTSKIFMNGDKYQVDIRKSGISDFLNIMDGVEGFGHMVLGDEYQIRHPMIVEMNKRYVEFLSR